MYQASTGMILIRGVRCIVLNWFELPVIIPMITNRSRQYEVRLPLKVIDYIQVGHAVAGHIQFIQG